MFRVTTTNGKVARGQILDIPDTTRVSNMNNVRRLFRVAPKTPLDVRDIIILPDQTKFILGEHGKAWNHGLLYRHFMAFEITGQFQWRSESVMIDPVTGLEVPAASTPVNIWASQQTLRDATDSKIGVAVDVDSLITDVLVQPGDHIDNRVVTDVSTQLGLTVVRLEHG